MKGEDLGDSLASPVGRVFDGCNRDPIGKTYNRQPMRCAGLEQPLPGWKVFSHRRHRHVRLLGETLEVKDATAMKAEGSLKDGPARLCRVFLPP